MRIDELIFEVRDSTRTRIGQLLPTDLVGWKSALRFNNVGTWELTLPATHDVGSQLALPGAGIIVTHKTAGVIFSGITTAAGLPLLVNQITKKNISIFSILSIPAVSLLPCPFHPPYPSWPSGCPRSTDPSDSPWGHI